MNYCHCFYFVCFGAFWFLPSEATLGWDGIQAVDVDGFKCLSENGFSFYIGRVWASTGEADSQGIQNIKNARAAGWQNVDGYIFPCFKEGCGSAKDQVKAVLDQLAADQAEIGMIWMDIEVQEWPSAKSVAQAFITEMVEQAESMGKKAGIYTSKNNWDQIVGADWASLSHIPLWYAHWNSEQSFDSFETFGGWSQPSIHQFEGDVDGPCGVNMDKNWYP